jgi:hypothetical protein
MPTHERFELRRQSDDLVYVFVLTPHPAGGFAYLRQDQDYWIVYRHDLGWVAWDEVSQSVTGRPWNVRPEDQGDHPPAGDWVSRKGPKSYVYSLEYVGP